MPPSCRATGRELATVVVTQQEQALVGTVTKMLSDPEWLLPVIAAQPQYRANYYGLTAAALLEDLWYDALSNWVARNEPGTVLEKTARGKPGASGDYLVGGLPYSHKSGDGPQDTGVHWDALAAAAKQKSLWTSKTALVYVATGYGGVTGEWSGTSTASASVPLRPFWPLLKKTPKSKVLSLVRWEPSGRAEVITTWTSEPDFNAVWREVAREVASGTPANHTELVWLPTKGCPPVGSPGTITLSGRPGFFVFPADLLQDVPTGRNNRGTLLKKRLVLALMESAMHLSTWTPMPMWYAGFAAPRPPDLYLAQRSEFDRRFSSAERA
ncbi:hypothetical protein [Cellulomonas iranensis]|uniref:hypothetical protein n=1 Tax=Cellulomonas iranensis TaxID=76862 RepID=UPI001177D14B|nr:hypothetical protein [Cellulomonas iranensis]